MTIDSLTIQAPGSQLLLMAYQLLSEQKAEEQNLSHQFFIDTIHRYEGVINRICYSFAAKVSTFDDLRQDALVNIWRGLDSFRRESSPQTWIYRVVLNTCVSTQRKEQRHQGFLSLDDVNKAAPEQNNDNVEILEMLISSLGDIDRSILLLWLEERPYEEIASIMGISRGNIASRLHRIKKKLNENYKQL